MMDPHSLGELLCHCLRPPEQLDIQRLHGLNDEQWQALVARAYAERVAPLLWSRLRNQAHRAPTHAEQQLTENYYRTAAVNTHIQNQIEQLCEKLDALDVPYLFLKGAHLAEHVYGNIAARTIGDIDVLLAREDCASADQALARAGYTVPAPYCWQKTRLESHHHHLAPRATPDRRIWVELHWQLLPPHVGVDVDIDSMRGRAVAFPMNKREVYGLATEDLLLHLALHTACTDHFGRGLRPLCDIAEVLHQHQASLDWSCLQSTAERAGAARYVTTTLAIAQRLFNAPVPASVTAALDDEASRMVELIADFLTAGASTTPAAERLAKVPGPWRPQRGLWQVVAEHLGEFRGLDRGMYGPFGQHHFNLLRGWLKDGAGLLVSHPHAKAARRSANTKAVFVRWLHADCAPKTDQS